ncbi:hypothetical protein H4R35_005608 [Dimargaris xerosporica]|nr:hypothetical protein H4R35_005608 [Dimargaris xerosporica]
MADYEPAHDKVIKPADHGYEATATRNARWWGERAFPTSNLARAALALAVTQAIVVVALEALVMKSHLDQISLSSYTHYNDKESFVKTMEESRPIIVYHAILVFAELFIIAAWWSALNAQNVIQTWAAVALNLLTIVYSVIQPLQHQHLSSHDIDHISNDHQMGFVYNTETIERALTGVVSFCSVAFIIMACLLHRQFAWSFYKRLGADIHVRNMNLHHLTLVTLLQLNLFFYICYCAQLLTLILKEVNAVNIVRLALPLPVGLFILFCGSWGLRHEHEGWMWAFMAGMLLVLAYLILELVVVVLTEATGTDVYMNTRDFMHFFSAVMLALTLVSIGYALRCYLNFNKGLKEARENSLDAEQLHAQYAIQPPQSTSVAQPSACHPDMRPLSSITIE